MAELEGDLRDSSLYPRGRLRVDMPAILSRTIIAPALGRFALAYPAIRLRLSAHDRTVDLVEGGIDVAIRIGELPPSGLIARPLAATSYLCCAAPAFIATHGQPATPEHLHDFACLGFIYPKSQQPRPWHFHRGGEQFTLSPHAVLETDHVESLIEAAKAGCGIVQVLSLSAAAAIRAGELVAVLADFTAPGPPVSAVYQQGQRSAAKVGAFVDFVTALFDDQAKQAR